MKLFTQTQQYASRRLCKCQHKQILTGTPEENTLLRPRRRWENDINTYPKQTMCDDMPWVHLIRDRVLCGLL